MSNDSKNAAPEQSSREAGYGASLQDAKSLRESREETAALDDGEDTALVQRCRGGDTHAYGLLVARHQPRVYSLVRRVLPSGVSPDDVDDLVQDVFVQVWRALPRFRGDARFSTWLYRIATNMAIKQWRRHKNRQQMMSDEELPDNARQALADPAPGPADEAERRARDHALRAAIEHLPLKQRTVVMLHYFEGMTCEEAALVIGCSVGTVWSRLYYACRKLRTTVGWLGS